MSRIFNRDNGKHEILGVQQVKPLELATQMTLDVPNAWGVLLAIVEACRALPVDKDQYAKYLVLKDPNKVRGVCVCVCVVLHCHGDLPF